MNTIKTINTVATAIALTFGIAAAAHAHPGGNMQNGQGAQSGQHQGMQGKGMHGMQGGMAHGQMQGGMPHGQMQGGMAHGQMQGMGPGAARGTPNAQGPRGPQAGQTLKTPEEQAAMHDKMQNAKTPEERREIAMANRAEMEKRAADQGITHQHRGPRHGATSN